MAYLKYYNFPIIISYEVAYLKYQKYVLHIFAITESHEVTYLKYVKYTYTPTDMNTISNKQHIQLYNKFLCRTHSICVRTAG